MRSGMSMLDAFLQKYRFLYCKFLSISVTYKLNKYLQKVSAEKAKFSLFSVVEKVLIYSFRVILEKEEKHKC